MQSHQCEEEIDEYFWYRFPLFLLQEDLYSNITEAENADIVEAATYVFLKSPNNLQNYLRKMIRG